MKKLAIILISVLLILSMVSCDILSGLIGSGDSQGQGGGSENPPSGGGSNEDNNDVVVPDEPDMGDGEDDSGENTQDPDNVNSHMIEVIAVRGLNEQIYIKIGKLENFSFNVFYKMQGDGEYTKLDSNLIIEAEDAIECYILGIKKGDYSIKIEAESENDFASKTYEHIEVEAQDRSGYAHFKSDEGVGAYNNDGTVKEGTKIVYVTNETKNTVTLEIDGTEYVGLVNILQAQYKSDTPMLVRIIGKITTNQWNYKNVEPRLSNGSNATDDFFENTFSTEYGENLANLIVKMKGNGGGAKTYNYRTTPDGLTDVRETNGGTKYTYYKGSDFPSFVGKSVYDDDSYYNMLEVKGSENITVEGVGSGAELFQFGIGFEECSSIEVKNLTFTNYPEDALNFLGGDRADLANYGRYWVHSCTFNRGYNAWDISGERDKYAGDGSIDFNNVSNLTLSYNHFNNSKKSMLFGSGDSEACMNFTMHHNYFFRVESRLPLGRNVNIHSYNNYFNQCGNCSDLRSNSYLFSENNYFNSTSKPFILSSSKVKSYGDIFAGSSASSATITNDRTKEIVISCKPDYQTSYSAFDINSELFYYDAENQKTDVSIMHMAYDLLDYVPSRAGAGCLTLIEIDN